MSVTDLVGVVVDNLSYGEGRASSLLAGLDTAGECAGIMLILGDQPGVTTDTIDRVAADWRIRPSWAAAASYRGTLGHPLVFAAAAFDDLRGLHGDKAVWKLIEGFPNRVSRIELDSTLPPDIDTPSNYELVRDRLGD